MELRNLKTFIQVAECGSFSETADQLGYAQSTITAQIASLEKELGVPLFTRYGKRFILSPEGSQLLEYANHLIKLETEARKLFQQDKGAPSGILRVGILESISASRYAEVFSQYMEQYPDVRLKITVATTLHLMDLLEKGLLDLIVTLDVLIRNPKFQCLLERPIPIYFFASADHLIFTRAKTNLKDLAEQRFLLTENGCNYRQVFEEILAKENLHVVDVLEIGYTQILIDCVSRGLGISLLPEFNLSAAATAGQISILDIQDCRIELFLQVLVRQKQWMSPAKKQFLYLLERLI